MENLQEYWYSELIENNRKILNEKLNNEIQKTENQLFGIFYDTLNTLKTVPTKDFIQELKTETEKSSRIIRREFHYQSLGDIQKSLLKLLKQFFDTKFPEIASDPKIWWLYFNQELKDIVRFDFIFWYIPHNPIISADIKNHKAKLSIHKPKNKTWESENKEVKIPKKKSEKKSHPRLAKWHSLLNTTNYSQCQESLLSWAQSAIQQYCQKFDIDKKDPIKYKKFLESYFIYIIKDSLLKNKLVLDMKNSKDLDILKLYIQDLINHLQQELWEELKLDLSIIIKKFFKNINSNEILPLEFTYQNTSIEDIFNRQEYFDKTYFLSQDTSSKAIYSQIMTEFGSQWDLIKSSHAILCPDYFNLKDKTEKLKSDLFILNNLPNKDINLQNIINSTNQELVLTMTKLDKHFYSSIDKNKSRWKWDSMEKIVQKYMKYYKIPTQYRRNFFIVVNYFNHYYNIRSDISQKANKSNQKLENLLLNSPNKNSLLTHFVNQYITTKQIQQSLQQKRDKNYQIKLEKLKKNVGSSHSQKDLDLILSKKARKEDEQLTLNF